MNLRAFLEAQGLSEKDIDEAVRESREAVVLVQNTAATIRGFLMVASVKTENEKVRKLMGIGVKAVTKVLEGSAELLKKR